MNQVMRIENLKSEEKNNLARVAATVIWEDCDRPAQEIYFETTLEFAQGLSCNPHAFLVACIMPAMDYGEERVFIDAEICPELRDGLMTAMGWVCRWYESGRQPVRIEAKMRSHLPTLRTPDRAGFFFSGGIDSLSTLRANRLDFSLEHHRSIKDGLLIHGIERHTVEDNNKQLENFERHLNSLSEIAQDAAIALIPVYTNVRCLEDSLDFWQYEFQAAVLSSVAHAFSRRLTEVTIASSEDIPYVEPYGSHPILDPNYSSSDLRIRHGSILLSRLGKTRLVAEWDVALQHMKPCTKNQYGKLNCGRCEKCIRTMTTLLALGVLDRASAFPQTDVSEELMLSGAYVDNIGAASDYLALVDLLEEKGRYDLVRGIKRIIARYHERDLKGIITRFDRQLFKGNLVRLGKKML